MSAAAAKVAAAEVRRANQLIYDQIAALGTFTSDSDAWYDWQKNFRRLTRDFDNDLRYRVFRLMCGVLAERRLDEALSSHPVPHGRDPYQHAVDILNRFKAKSRRFSSISNQSAIALARLTYPGFESANIEQVDGIRVESSCPSTGWIRNLNNSNMDIFRCLTMKNSMNAIRIQLLCLFHKHRIR